MTDKKEVQVLIILQEFNSQEYRASISSNMEQHVQLVFAVTLPQKYESHKDHKSLSMAKIFYEKNTILEYFFATDQLKENPPLQKKKIKTHTQ